MKLNLTLSPDRVARQLVLAIVCLCAASVGAQAVRITTSSPTLQAATNIFKVDRESSIPAYFSAVMLLAAGVAAAVIARRNRGRPYARHWKWLAAIFVVLSIDEAVAIHELSIAPLRELLGVGGFLMFAWVLPAAALLIVFAAAYWRFWTRLPSPLRGQLAVAGSLYVGCALGLEMIGARLFEQFGRMDVRYALIALVEEAGEMFAIALLLRALLLHLAGAAGVVQIQLTGGAPDPPSVPVVPAAPDEDVRRSAA